MGNTSTSIAKISSNAAVPAAPKEAAFLWHGEFVDEANEAAFREATWTETLERTRGIQLGVYVFAACIAIDYFVLGFGTYFYILALTRAMSILVARLPLAAFSDPHHHKKFYAALTFAELYVFGTFLIAVYAGGFNLSEQALSALMIIFAFYFGVPNRLSFNAAASIFATIAFMVTIAQFDAVSMRQMGLVAILMLIGNFTGIQTVRVSNRTRRVEFLNTQHHREINEMLKHEIATRQAAERAAAVTEENFLSIFVAAPQALAIIDPMTHRVIQANRKALELFGAGQDMTGIDSRTLFVDEEVRHRISEAAVVERPRTPIEARLTTANGDIIWAHISAALVRFHGLPSMLVALQDVTARRREAEALREARDQATDSSRSKSEFLANMSHELRTPLNAIIGFSEALERELFGPVGNPRYREYAVDIHDSGVHLLNLINDILDLSKIEAGHFKLHEDETDLDGIVASACRIVRHRAQQASISIDIHLPKPAVSLVADERALKQILINLVSNAVKFSNDGSTVRVEGQVTARGLRIAVIDQGVGIDVDDIPKALSPFTQLDGTLSRAHEGTGLGLPLAKHMTELHGGKLSIESEVGKGTAVYVDLPAERITSEMPGLFAIS